MLKSIIGATCTCLSIISFNVNAALIDTAEITATASGSINSIGGFASFTDPIFIPDGAVVDYFTVELSSFNTDVEDLSLPSTLTLSFRNINPDTGQVTDDGTLQWTKFNGGVFVGRTLTVSETENADTYAMMLGYMPDSGVEPPELIRTNMIWDFGGLDVVATAIFTVEAHGTLVPVPATVWLFGSGLLGLIGIARRKSSI